MTAASKDTAKAAGNTAVPDTAHGDHDRVAMLSLKADGTPDQTPGVEIIGDKDFALSATKEQFKQQAVSVADTQRIAEQNAAEAVETEQDPTIKAAQEEHAKVAEAAEKAAESTVGALFTGDDKSNTKSSDKS